MRKTIAFLFLCLAAAVASAQTPGPQTPAIPDPAGPSSLDLQTAFVSAVIVFEKDRDNAISVLERYADMLETSTAEPDALAAARREMASAMDDLAVSERLFEAATFRLGRQSGNPDEVMAFVTRNFDENRSSAQMLRMKKAAERIQRARGMKPEAQETPPQKPLVPCRQDNPFSGSSRT